MKGIDPIWIIALGVLVTIEQAIGQGTVALTNVVPAAYAPYVQGWCTMLAFIGTTIMTGLAAWSSNKVGPFVQALPGPSTSTAAKIAIGFLVIGAALSVGMPAKAMAQTPQAMQVPMPKAKRVHVAASTPTPAMLAANASAPAAPTPKAGQLTAAQVQQNPILLLQQFTASDLQAALTDANAQTPPDTTSAACYTALLAMVNSPINNPLPSQLGLFLALQKARDAEAFLANLQSPTGPLSALNVACAPLVMDVNTTLLALGVTTGLVVGTGGIAIPALPGLASLLAILPK